MSPNRVNDSQGVKYPVPDLSRKEEGKIDCLWRLRCTEDLGFHVHQIWADEWRDTRFAKAFIIFQIWWLSCLDHQNRVRSRWDHILCFTSPQNFPYGSRRIWGILSRMRWVIGEGKMMMCAKTCHYEKAASIRTLINSLMFNISSTTLLRKPGGLRSRKAYHLSGSWLGCLSKERSLDLEGGRFMETDGLASAHLLCGQNPNLQLNSPRRSNSQNLVLIGVETPPGVYLQEYRYHDNNPARRGDIWLAGLDWWNIPLGNIDIRRIITFLQEGGVNGVIAESAGRGISATFPQPFARFSEPFTAEHVYAYMTTSPPDVPVPSSISRREARIFINTPGCIPRVDSLSIDR